MPLKKATIVFLGASFFRKTPSPAPFMVLKWNNKNAHWVIYTKAVEGLS